MYYRTVFIFLIFLPGSLGHFLSRHGKDAQQPREGVHQAFQHAKSRGRCYSGIAKPLVIDIAFVIL